MGSYQEEARPLHAEAVSPVAHDRRPVAGTLHPVDGFAMEPDLLHHRLREEDVAHRRVLHEEAVLDHLTHHLVVRHAAGEEEWEYERAVVRRRPQLVQKLHHLLDAVHNLWDT